MKPIPIIRVDAKRAEDAWAVHSALLEAEHRDPTLRDNPAWRLVRMDAFEAFCMAFERA